MNLKSVYIIMLLFIGCSSAQAQIQKDVLRGRYDISLGGQTDSLVSKDFFKNFNWVVVNDEQQNFAMVPVKGFTVYVVPKEKSPYIEQVNGNKIPERTIQRILSDVDTGTMVVITEVVIDYEGKDIALNGIYYRVTD